MVPQLGLVEYSQLLTEVAIGPTGQTPGCHVTPFLTVIGCAKK